MRFFLRLICAVIGHRWGYDVRHDDGSGIFYTHDCLRCGAEEEIA